MLRIVCNGSTMCSDHYVCLQLERTIDSESYPFYACFERKDRETEKGNSETRKYLEVHAPICGNREHHARGKAFANERKRNHPRLERLPTSPWLLFVSV